MSGESSQPSDEEKLYFLFGSETGNAESIAKRLHHDAVNTHDLPHALCMSLNQIVTKKVLDEHLSADVATSLCLVIVCSTTGEGEPPQNAARFRRWLRNTAGTLHKVRYCVLALGDTNYNSFCAPGIFMDNKLNEMGAVRCYPRGEADDGVGLDLVVDPWTESVWPALKKTTADSSEAVGREKYNAGETRVDMSVAQEAAIIYSNASQLCSVTALFLFERIVELGGKADLYPIQYFSPKTSLSRPAKVVLFVVATDSDEGTLCEHCACQPQQLPPLGPFSTWVCSSSSSNDCSVPPPADAAELQEWLADPSLRYFNSLVIAPRTASAAQAAKVDTGLKAVAASGKLDFLCRRQSTGEIPSVATTDNDVFYWVEGVLDSLPGVTASTEVIHQTMEYFFNDRVGAECHSAWSSSSSNNNAADDCAVHEQNGTIAGAAAGMAAVSAATTHKTSTTGSSRPRRRYGLHEREDAYSSTADGGVGHTHTPLPPPQQQARGPDGTVRKTHQVLDDLLTPVVFLYSDKSAYVKQCALDIFGAAGQHHLRSSVCEVSNFRQTGFPRRATFVFIVSGVLTKSMARVLKVLRTLQAQGKQVDGVNFAILGIDKASESDKFNACALELETLLLEMKATKIHCTGLADMDCGSLLPIIQSWESNLWSAIVHPMRSAAYLDVASPNIHVQQSFSPLAGAHLAVSGSFPPAAAAVVSPRANGHSTDRRTSLTSPSTAVEGPESGFVRVGNAGSGTFPYQPPGSTVADLVPAAPSSASPVAASLGSVPGGGSVAAGHLVSVSSPTAEGASMSAQAAAAAVAAAAASSVGGVAGFGSSLFPWDTVPLHKDKAPHTPVAFLYASAGMSKTMAVNAAQAAQDKGFPAVLHSFANYHLIDLHACPNLILFCEAGPDGQSNGGRRFKKFLTNPLHRPDDLSHVRFAVLGLCSTPANVVHPAFLWAKLLSRLQANRVFPVVIMPSLSQLHSLGIPWAECVLASMALLPPTAQLTDPTPRTATPAANQGSVDGGTEDATRAAHAGDEHTEGFAITTDAGGVPAAIDPQRCILFLFGSSTGITESIARDLHREALEKGFPARVAALKYFQKMNFLSTANVVLVCSTIPTAPGGFPRNARSFARYLLAPDQPTTLLSGSSFAVLGVGNGSATAQGPEAYCRTAVRFDRRMAELGGHRLCEVGTVDASQSIAQPVEAWRQDMFAALERRAFEHAAALKALEKEEGEQARQRELPLPLSHTEPGHHGGDATTATKTTTATAAAWERLGAGQLEKASNSSAAAVAEHSPLRPLHVMIAYCCAPQSVVEELTEHLARVMDETTPIVPTVCTLNDLLKRNWRSDFDMVVFVVGQNSEAEFPMNGSAFARVLRQRTTPLDMFASVSYTVLAVSDSNSTQFYMGRQMDRRLEELGGTRVYARGEVVDSFRLERTVEKWSSGLMNLLVSMCETANHRSSSDAEMEGESNGDAHTVGGSTAPSEVNAGRLLHRLRRTHDAALVHGDERSGAQPTTAALRQQQAGSRTGALRTHAECDDGGEDPQSRLSRDADGGRSHGGGSSAQDWQTESSLVNRIAYSADNAGDRVDGLVKSWMLLTSPLADRPVLQLNLSVCAETQWTPGQTVAILPSNNAAEVEALLHVFGVAHHEHFHPLSIAGADASSFPTSPLYNAVDFPVSCGMILLRYVDLRVTRSHKVLFQLLEANAPTAEERAAVQKCHQDLSVDRTPRTLLEVLETFPRCVPPFRHCVENLTLLQPRQYSICSSHQADATTLSICFKFVEKGLCTGWMCEQCLWAAKLPTTAIARVFEKSAKGPSALLSGDAAGGELVAVNTLVLAKRRVLIPFVIRHASEFRMPRDPLIPMVLIGPGTGIAPFRAFLQEREAWMTQRQQQCGSTCPKSQLCGCPYTEATHTGHAICGSIDLFHGCQRSDTDFLYGAELQHWEEDGVLHSMTVAFSREPNEGGFWYGGCYVQDKLQECAVALMDLVTQRNAHIFVCGDADGMAKEVHATLLELIQQHLSLSSAAAVEYLDQMSRDGRYLRDVWSSSF